MIIPSAMEKNEGRGESKEISVICNLTKVGNLFRINNQVTAKEDVFITSFSSLFFNGVATGADFNSEEVLLHFCRQTWEGEAQWQKVPVKNLGFFDKSTHQSTDSFHIVNTGSFTTAKFYPNFFIEDCKNKKIWVFQFEPVGNYHIEIGYDYQGCLFVNLECVNDRYLNSGISLKKGEQYTTESVLFGAVDGDINDMLSAFTIARRESYKRTPLPLTFNDYMNCLWGNPDEDKLLPLIDKAAEAGAQAFCIDAGWFMPKGEGWKQCLGDWEESKDRFPEKTFKGIIDYIHSKNMLAGCWLEMECASIHAKVFQNADDWFLCKYGKRIGAEVRYFLNFANEAVRDYMHNKVAHLYQMGIRYIKNDYNECLGSGVDFGDGNSLGIGVNKAINAFLSFVDDVKETFPDLIIENCASGAMRSDYGALSHFDIQSLTDQEDFVMNHAITVGSLLNILPEHMGVWSYPIPLDYENLKTPEVLDKKEYLQRFADGEQTVFNIANGMLGNLYLSGRIDKADALNFSLIQDGVKYYLNNKKELFNAIPQLLTELPALGRNNEFSAILLKGENKSFLFVFRLGEKDTVTLNISRFFDSFSLEIGYGKIGGKTISASGDNVIISMPKKNTAMVIEIIGEKE